MTVCHWVETVRKLCSTDVVGMLSVIFGNRSRVFAWHATNLNMVACPVTSAAVSGATFSDANQKSSEPHGTKWVERKYKFLVRKSHFYAKFRV
ncbi:hypothetical protein T265_11916 [Opisthorchis viverrini]|uniref:Uncharacterized protein n=1 Tax=Opisthorchis viverrini TaxID=6198 RepID=A0A074YX79_OPIVI|nr:hypothetical protein T265_11916 [Opisthorchis viverrini]KER19248.1 hypothetical protein T265_11916 [Opisthorchis viverrini]